MRVMVYGAGVIGSYLAHVLCAAGHDVSLLARGSRKAELEEKGLVVVHHRQRRTTADRPRITDRLDPGDRYDAVFAVMQYQQMGTILDDLAACASPLVVLVGNNASAAEMDTYLKAHCVVPKTILFGFQGTGGRREAGKVICIRLGAGSLQCGLLHGKPDEAVRKTLAALFAGTKYKAVCTPDMDAWYKGHLAMILPVCYLCYRHGCDLKQAAGQELKLCMAAIREGYGLLSELGYPILPEGSEAYFERGPRGAFLYVLLRLMAGTELGRLAASDHCRNAVEEMQALDKAFDALRGRRPDFPMPAWQALEQYMPGKEEGKYG